MFCGGRSFYINRETFSSEFKLSLDALQNPEPVIPGEITTATGAKQQEWNLEQNPTDMKGPLTWKQSGKGVGGWGWREERKSRRYICTYCESMRAAWAQFKCVILTRIDLGVPASFTFVFRLVSTLHSHTNGIKPVLSEHNQWLFGNCVTRMNLLFYSYDFTPQSNKITRNIKSFHVLKCLPFE